jgi:hypothetical protein
LLSIALNQLYICALFHHLRHVDLYSPIDKCSLRKTKKNTSQKTEGPFFKKKKTFQQNQNVFQNEMVKNAFSPLKNAFFLKNRAFVLLERILPLSNLEQQTTLFIACLTDSQIRFSHQDPQ